MVWVVGKICTSILRVIGVPVAVPVGGRLAVHHIAGRALVSCASILAGSRSCGLVVGVVPRPVGGILRPAGKCRGGDGQTGHQSGRQQRRCELFHLFFLLLFLGINPHISTYHRISRGQYTDHIIVVHHTTFPARRQTKLVDFNFFVGSGKSAQLFCALYPYTLVCPLRFLAFHTKTAPPPGGRRGLEGLLQNYGFATDPLVGSIPPSRLAPCHLPLHKGGFWPGACSDVVLSGEILPISSLKSDNRNTAVPRPPCVKGAVTVGDWGIVSGGELGNLRILQQTLFLWVIPGTPGGL